MHCLCLIRQSPLTATASAGEKIRICTYGTDRGVLTKSQSAKHFQHLFLINSVFKAPLRPTEITYRHSNTQTEGDGGGFGESRDSYKNWLCVQVLQLSLCCSTPPPPASSASSSLPPIRGPCVDEIEFTRRNEQTDRRQPLGEVRRVLD